MEHKCKVTGLGVVVHSALQLRLDCLHPLLAQEFTVPELNTHFPANLVLSRDDTFVLAAAYLWAAKNLIRFDARANPTELVPIYPQIRSAITWAYYQRHFAEAHLPSYAMSAANLGGWIKQLYACKRKYVEMRNTKQLQKAAER